MPSRREFNSGLASLAFGGLALAGCAKLRNLPEYAARNPGFRTADMRVHPGYGGLRHRPDKPLLNLPEGLRYEVVSCKGQELAAGGGLVPDQADGMGSFDLGGDRVALVRNHEVSLVRNPGPGEDGGTTTIVYDYRKQRLVSHHRSLVNTSRNCSGGVTPWGTWLSCEEEVDLGPEHGWVYQVPAIHDGLVQRDKLRRLGRFNHEAAVVDSATNIVYMTEDRIDGLFYRFVPRGPKAPLTAATEGELQALAFGRRTHGRDSRNWGAVTWPQGEWRETRWVTIDDVESGSRADDLRKRGWREGAVRFACGEGIHFGDGELYFTVTSGGQIKSGQIMRYRPGEERIQLFLESTDPARLNYCDNLTIAPNGHLFVCEDAYVGGHGNYWLRAISGAFGDAPGCYLRGVTAQGELYDIAFIPGEGELAGACFSPDGQTLFINIYSPAATLAITGDWGWEQPLVGWSIPQAGGLPALA